MASIAKKLSFTLLMMICLLGLAEAGLRATMPDLEAVVSPLLYQRNSGQAFTPGRAPDSRVYVSGRRRVVTNKKAGVRILVFGASAAYGEMYSPFTAFPGQAEQALRRANPDIAIEILNLAHGGMGSRQVGEMVFRALENDDPDLVVIYTGNNEYHELRALKASSSRYDPSAELLRRRLSKSYVYRQLRDVFIAEESTLTPPDQTDWLPIGRMDVTVDRDDRELGLALYREHLQSIVLAAREHGVPVLLSTVATNSRDHVDNGTPGVASEEEIRALQRLQGIVDKVPKARFAAEAGQVTHAIKTEGGLHRLGKLYLTAGLAEVAASTFEHKELAALRPMTSNRAMRTVVKDLGQQYATAVCDLAADLAAGSEDGIPGNAEFIDHCHPNAAGHSRLGLGLAECILDLGIGGLKRSSVVETAEAISPYRIDQYAGHRRIPGAKTNPSAPNLDTAEGLAEAGHHAFTEEQFDRAAAAYQASLDKGGDIADLAYSSAMTSLYSGDLVAARAALERAVAEGHPVAAAALSAISP